MRKPLHLSAVFDIETEDWTKFVMGAIRTKEGTEVYYDEDQLCDALLSIEGRVWAHNLGRFDGLWLLDRMHKRKRKVEIVNAASRVVSAKVGETEFADSLALVPMSLAEWTGEKEATGLPCVCGPLCGCNRGCLEDHNCGGYCSIKRNMPTALRAKLRAYLVNDVEILWRSLTDLEAFAAEHDLDLGLTIGGSSWSTVQRKLELESASWRGTTRTGWKGLTYEGIRDGYYGGRPQVFRPKLARGYLADVNSLYPAQLASVRMPMGEPRDSYQPGRDYEAGRAGVFNATVEASGFLPPLPVRVRDRAGTSRIAYPTGRFSGTWTGLELRRAERSGARVLQINRALVWPRSEVLFEAWMGKLFSLRAKAGKKSWLGKWLKLYMNSLTGKFAMRPARARYMMNPEVERLKPWDAERCAKFCGNPRKCRAKCGAALEVSPGIWKAETYFVNPCAHVEWAGHLTAGGRGCLLDGLSEPGIGPAYCDTDSVFSERHMAHTGAELGEFEGKGPIRNFEALAPKVYSYEELGCEEDGKWKTIADSWRHGDAIPPATAGGLSTPLREFQILTVDGQELRQVTRLNRVGFEGLLLGRGRVIFFQRDQIKRTVRLAIKREGAYGDRVLDGETTRPRDISEFREVL